MEKIKFWVREWHNGLLTGSMYGEYTKLDAQVRVDNLSILAETNKAWSGRSWDIVPVGSGGHE